MNTSETTYHECLDIIYTHEHGQVQCTIPLTNIGFAFMLPKDDFFKFLKADFDRHSCFREVNTPEKEPPKLHKISCCVHSKEWVEPSWYKECEGKMYFEN